MAASGIPEKRKDHAFLMARFAKDCLKRMLDTVRRLEVRLGPDTGELGMRIGIHSGPVTAGVLRGEKARFQLFGDTVNTAARMESTGVKNKIQLSAETAALLRDHESDQWKIVPRENKVEAKGKGLLQTYWLVPNQLDASIRTVTSVGSASYLHNSLSDSFMNGLSDGESETEDLSYSERTKLDRTIDWNVDVLLTLLKRVVAMRESSQGRARKLKRGGSFFQPTSMPIDEVKDIITLPSEERVYNVNPEYVQLPPKAILQLHDFVRTVAELYR